MEALKTFTVQFVLSTECNGSCSFCYEKSHKVAKCMSDEVITRGIEFIFASKKASEYVFWIFGGEPVLQPKATLFLISEIVRLSKIHNTQCTAVLFTNAITYEEDITKALVEANKSPNVKAAVQVSYEGPKSSRHRNTPLSVIRENISRYVLEPSLQVEMRSTFNPIELPSVTEIVDIYRFSVELGVDNVTFFPTIENEWRVEDVEIIKESYSKIGDLILANQEIGKSTHFVDFEYSKFHFAPPGFLCESGTSLLSIDSDGNVFPCARMMPISSDFQEEFRMGNIFTSVEFLPSPNNPPEDCASCEVDICSVCKVINRTRTGKEETKVEAIKSYCNLRKAIHIERLKFIEKITELPSFNKKTEEQQLILDAMESVFLNILVVAAKKCPEVYKIQGENLLISSPFKNAVYDKWDAILTIIKIAYPEVYNKYIPLQHGNSIEDEVATIARAFECMLVEIFGPVIGISGFPVEVDDPIARFTRIVSIVHYVTFLENSDCQNG